MCLDFHCTCVLNGKLFVCLLLYVPSQQLWSWRDSLFTLPLFFLGKLEQAVNHSVLRTHTFACNWQQPFLNESAEGRRMTLDIISWSISMKVWDRNRIKLLTPGSAVRHASVVRHFTNCPTRPDIEWQIYPYNGYQQLGRFEICLLWKTHSFSKKIESFQHLFSFWDCYLHDLTIL